MAKSSKFNLKKLIWRYTPGIISGAADNDPSGITTYSIAGARFGYSQNFLMVWATPMLIAVQSMAGRLGDARGKGLTAIMSDFLPRPLVYLVVLLLVFANTFTLTADIAGMASTASLVLPLSDKFWATVFSLLAWYLVLFKSYKELQRYFLWLVIFFLAYVPAAFLSGPDWGEVLRDTLLPRINLSTAFLLASLATMGTTITPYLFFWQAKEEVELRHSKRFFSNFAQVESLSLAPGLIFSQLITLFIIIACGATLYRNGFSDIGSAVQAAQALEPLVGPAARYLFALGLIGSGLLAIPILSSTTAYAVSELFGWRDSLWDKVKAAKRFYAIITLTIFISLIAAFLPFDPIKMLFYSQVINGVISPFLVIFLLIFCNSRQVMGGKVNGFFDNFFGGLAVLVMSFSILYLVLELLG